MSILKLHRSKPSRATPVTVRSGEFDWHGHCLAYQLYGESGTPCVLVHGILLDSTVNRGLAMRLVEEGFQVALLDLLGHGHSERSARVGDHRVDFYGDQMVALLDHLGWKRALVGGVSLGAIASLHMAVQAPKRVLGLFLEMPVMEASTPSAALLLVPPMLIVRYGATLWRPLARLFRALPRPRGDLAATLLNALSAEPENTAAIIHGVLVGPVVPPYAERCAIRAPTLVIGHGRDRLHELHDARRLAEEIPDAHLIQAHSILELRTRPERLWPQIHDFLLHDVQQGGSATALAAASPRPRRRSTRSSRTAINRNPES